MKHLIIILITIFFCLADEKKYLYILSASVDFGGEAVVTSTSGKDQLNANEGYQISLGLEYFISNTFSILSSIGIKRYERNDIDIGFIFIYPWVETSNISYEVYPIELSLNLLTPLGNFGTGIIYQINPSISIVSQQLSGNSSAIYSFDNAFGWIFTYEPTFLINRKSMPWGVKITKLQYTYGNDTFDASSAGFYISFKF